MTPFRHLYLHIPFCRHKCGYCDFNAYAGMQAVIPSYCDALLEELRVARERFPFEPLRTVYLGGGTPSLLSPEQLSRLMSGVRELFAVQRDAEVTLEANPASTDDARLAAWRAAGVNRLSIGVQGFDPVALAVLERRTDGRQAVGAFRLARAAGFDNISVDLIYAVPGQTEESWRQTVRRAIELGPDHFSCYCLSFEEGTLLHRRRAAGLVGELDADAQWRLLELATAELTRAGYERYEVSSWARPGSESRHNGAYWECRPVYGAGAGAHTYATDGELAWRWWNVARPRAYIAAVPDVRMDGEELTPRQAAAERLMLGLRRTSGLAVPDGFESELAELEAAGLVERHEGSARPSRRGLDLHNQIALALL